MPSTPSAIGNRELQATGENINAWGDKLNDLFSQGEDMCKGVVAITVDAAVTLSNTNYVDNEARHMGLLLSGAGGETVTLPASQQGIWLVVNACTSDVTFEVGSGGSSQVIKAGRRKHILTDGTTLYASEDGANKEYVDAQTALKLSLTGGTLTGDLTLSGAPTSNLHAATKKYVDDAAFNEINLPGQSGNADKFLKTDGTNASWADVSPELPTTFISSNVTAVINNAYGADSTTASRTVTLPPHSEDGVVLLFDADGNASNNNAIFSDGTDTWTVDVDYGWILLVSKSSVWRIKQRG